MLIDLVVRNAGRHRDVRALAVDCLAEAALLRVDPRLDPQQHLTSYAMAAAVAF